MSESKGKLPAAVEAGHQRYYMVPSATMPNYFDVVDAQIGSVACSWPREMAIMLGMMYQNTCNSLGFREGNEFMFGVVLGQSMAVIHAAKLPKVTTVSDEHGGVTMTFVMPDGATRQETHSMGNTGAPVTTAAMEIRSRIVGSECDTLGNPADPEIPTKH